MRRAASVHERRRGSRPLPPLPLTYGPEKARRATISVGVTDNYASHREETFLFPLPSSTSTSTTTPALSAFSSHPSSSTTSLMDISTPTSVRWPDPDPSDPFAPMWQLRHRAASIASASEVNLAEDKELVQEPEHIDGSGSPTSILSPKWTNRAVRRSPSLSAVSSTSEYFEPSSPTRSRPFSESNRPRCSSMRIRRKLPIPPSIPSSEELATVTEDPSSSRPRTPDLHRSSVSSKNSSLEGSNSLVTPRDSPLRDFEHLPKAGSSSDHDIDSTVRGPRGVRWSLPVAWQPTGPVTWDQPLHHPTPSQLAVAGSLEIVNAEGYRKPFRSLLPSGSEDGPRALVVIFIRHFFCHMCQDYISSVLQAIDPGYVKQEGIRVVFIGNGSHTSIEAYKRIHQLPYDLFTDPSLTLFRTLGLLRPTKAQPTAEASFLIGSYVKYEGLAAMKMVVRNVLRTGMPWLGKGDAKQLGGEFVFTYDTFNGVQCKYAHRMRDARSHAPFGDVLSSVGININWR